MTTRRNRLRYAATAVALVACLSSCSSGDSSDGRASSSSSSVAAHPVSGFQSAPAWRQTSVVAGQDAAVMTTSVLATVIGGSGSAFRVQGRDVATGQVQWASDESVFPAGSGRPSLSMFSVDGHSYVVARVGADAGTRVSVFDADGSTMDEKPVVQFTAAKDARIGVSPYGVIVTGDHGQHSQYVVDAAGARTVPYGGSPRVGSGTGTPVASGPGGTYVTDYGTDGFGVATQGSTYGWASKDAAHPSGVGKDQAGSLLSTNGHLIVSKWSPSSGSGHVLAVQDANDGRVIFSGTTNDDPKTDTDTLPVMSADGDYVVWDGYVFDRWNSRIRKLDALNGVHVSFIVRDHAYGVRSDGTGVTIDLKAPADKGQTQKSEPVGLTHSGIGVFVDSGALYAQPLS